MDWWGIVINFLSRILPPFFSKPKLKIKVSRVYINNNQCNLEIEVSNHGTKKTSIKKVLVYDGSDTYEPYFKPFDVDGGQTVKEDINFQFPAMGRTKAILFRLSIWDTREKRYDVESKIKERFERITSGNYERIALQE